jgi:hypothetical protein
MGDFTNAKVHRQSIRVGAEGCRPLSAVRQAMSPSK